MKIELVKERRKTISIKVLDSKNAILKVPKTLSEKKIGEFLVSKRVWIKKAVEKMEKIEHFSDNFQFDKFIYLNGQKTISTNELSMYFQDLPLQKQKSLIRKHYLSYFPKLERLVEEIALKTGMNFQQIKSTNSVRVWGSFNSAGVMKLNWKLVILPQNLVEYVIIHELCHGRHMNHSPKFWKEVARFCPEYRKMKKELTYFSFLLKTDQI